MKISSWSQLNNKGKCAPHASKSLLRRCARLTFGYLHPENAPKYHLLSNSGIFDPVFYKRQIADRSIPLYDLTPVEHYFTIGDDERISPCVLFDSHFYHESNPDVTASKMCSLVHYLRHGDKEGRNPHPMFDVALVRTQLGPDRSKNALKCYLESRGPELQPHLLVDPAHIWSQQKLRSPHDTRPTLIYYLDQNSDEVNPSPQFDGYSYRMMYPDIRDMPPFYHYIRYGRFEGRRLVEDKASNRHVERQIIDASRLDPDILKPFVDPMGLKRTFAYAPERGSFRVYEQLRAEVGLLRCATVIFVPYLKRAGAEKVVLNTIKVLLTHYPRDRIAVVLTDQNIREGTEVILTSERISVADISHLKDISETEIANTLALWLQNIGARRVFIANSRVAWKMVERFGKSLAQLLDIFAFCFCYDFDNFGNRAGFAWTHLGHCIDYLKGVISDNRSMLSQFSRDHRMTPENNHKLRHLYQPFDNNLVAQRLSQIRCNLMHPRPRHTVLWAGRFHRQKGVEIALAIGQLMPDFDFILGGGTAADVPRTVRLPANCRCLGEYRGFADLPYHEASLFLHTSLWDGLPNVLLEAISVGLPVIARDVGGVGELVNNHTGWLMPPNSSADSYAETIREVIQRSSTALARLERALDLLRAQHSWSQFAHNLVQIVDHELFRDDEIISDVISEEVQLAS